MNFDDMALISKTITRGVTIITLRKPPIDQTRLLEISELCLLGFRPIKDEPLEEQQRRLVLAIEERIKFLLPFLLELEPNIDAEETDDV